MDEAIGITGRLALAAGLALAGAAGPATGQAADTSIGVLTAAVVADGFDHPWGLAFLPDGRMLVTERSGTLRIVTMQGTVSAPVAGVPSVLAGGQGGLLDVAVAPDFETSGRIYLSFSEPPESAGLQRGSGTAVLAGTLALEADGGALGDGAVIFRQNAFSVSNRHYGSRIVVGADGNLFVTIGDRGDMDRAQDAGDHAGTVVRIGPDGAVPAGNPGIEGWAPEIWSIGHRNPQGATLGPDGALFTVEHGPRGGDALHRPEAGRNYGWPVITYGVDYSGAAIGVGTEAEGMEQPLHHWTPSISPSGLAYVTGALFAGWEGDFVTGGLSGQTMARLDMEDGAVVGEERLFEGQLGRVRDVRLGPDGALYVLIDASPGALYRIAPEGR